MKNLIFVYFLFMNLLISSCATLDSTKSKPNILILDSSFAPIQLNGKIVPNKSCFLINENNQDVPSKGDCFDKNSWDRLKTKDQSIIDAYLEANARKTSPLAKKWSKVKNTAEAKTIKSDLKLATHGSRSLYLIDKYSQHNIVPILIRNLTTTVGGTQNNSNTCKLKAWSKEQIEAFNGGGLQEHQERLSKVLRSNQSVRVVNISLGYKKSWISEDNPTCKKDQIDTEYKTLQTTWRNLLRRHPKTLFVVAAGNEGEDFSKKTVKNNDLWGSLSEENNLVVVGSLDASHKRVSFSNFGLKNMYWELGQDVPILYPHPTKTGGYPSMSHGTSATAAMMSGKILKALSEGISLDQLRQEISLK